MQHKMFLPSDIVLPVQPASPKRDIAALKADVDRHDLTDMWNMMLTIDYQVSSIEELDADTREEFCGIVSLLLQAFSDDD